MTSEEKAMLIGQRIKAARERLNFSQSDLRKKTNIKKSAIIAYEDGKRIPSLQNLANIAQALEVSIDELYFGDDSVSFIEKAPNVGAKIINCMYELVKERVLCVNEYSFTTRITTLRIPQYTQQIVDLVDGLEIFFNKIDTYPDPDGFIRQFKDSAAKEINDMIKDGKKHVETYKLLKKPQGPIQ